MKTALSNFSFVVLCFLTFALTAFAEEQYLGTVAAGGNNVGSLTANPDGGTTPLVNGFVIAPGTFLTLQNPDGGLTTACVNAFDAGCTHPVQILPGYPLFTKCKNLTNSYSIGYTQLDGGPGAWTYSGCLVQGPTNLDVFLRRGDER